MYRYSSPWQATYGSSFGGFQIPVEELADKWAMIPNDVDVLLTHCPPLGHGDLSSRRVRAGSVDLLLQLETRLRPRSAISIMLSYFTKEKFVFACPLQCPSLF